MRKHTIIFLLLLTGSRLFAQTEAGSIFVAGSTNMNATFINRTYAYNGQTLNTIKITSYNLHSTIGYFPVNNFAVGLSFSWASTKTDQMGIYIKTTDLVVGPSVRYYFGHNKFKPFVTGDFGVTWSRVKQPADDALSNEKIYSGYSYGLGLGASYFINEYFSIETSIGYVGSNTKNVDDSYYTYNNNGLSLNIGFAVTL
jgi:hypothetical protein